MRILACEPYYGGSHRAFLDGWARHSRHDFTLLTAPAHHWKWRMRQAAMSFARQLRDDLSGRTFDALFCSSMLNLAEFIGLAPQKLGGLPAVVYFHENQLSYPDRHRDVRDVHFGLIHLSSLVAADAVWFNSVYHRDTFRSAMAELLWRMPQPRLEEELASVEGTFAVQYPGIAPPGERPPRPTGPIRILWAARWEHDKNPEDFFASLEAFDAAGEDFRLGVIGEQFRDAPEVFDRARQRWSDRLDYWGYQPDRQTYRQVLGWADVCVSTAVHEFFGLAMVEAARAGVLPLLPRRLAYPELFGRVDGAEAFFYDGSVAELSARLVDLARRCREGSLWPDDPNRLSRAMQPFDWTGRAPALDAAMEQVWR
jgi:glycosyltransferase involved in cell wall biosynthesis